MNETPSMEISIGVDGGGWYVEWYIEDDEGGSVARWYGTEPAVRERAKLPAPSLREFSPLSASGNGPPPYDAATGTGMYDEDY